VRSQENVGGFDIAVDDALSMEVFNAIENSKEDLE
jgi:hypothetical protein